MKGKDSTVFRYLISHSGFRDWVQSPDVESNFFWAKWMEENPGSISELRKAREFIERMQFRNVQLSTHELDQILGNIIARESEEYQPTITHKRFYSWESFAPWVKVAAILLFSISAALVFKVRMNEVQEKPQENSLEWVVLENVRGSKSRVTLSDCTHVILNYESKLRFPKVFYGETRNVELIGEAYFDVAHNEKMPFIVSTGDIKTKVLGTSFNISLDETKQEIEVSLVTGKVEVNQIDSNLTQKVTHLFPGEQLYYNIKSKESVKTNFDIKNRIAWKDGVIVVEDASLPEFIEQLESWFGVSFQVFGSPSKGWKINGRYENQKLEDILTGLNFVYGVEYKIQGKNVLLNFK